MADAVTGRATATGFAAERRFSLQGWGPALVLAAAWLMLIVATTLYRGDFLSHQTVLAVTFTMAIVGILSLAQSLVAISGGFLDLSQPASLVLTGYVVTRLLEMGWPPALVIVASVAVGAGWGLFNAAIIVYGKLNPVIVTLATNFIGLAVLFLIFQIAQAPINSSVRAFGRGSFLGLPNIWWPMVALILIAGFFLPRTRYGRHMIAVGGSSRFAAQTRGISLKRTRFLVFTAAGAFIGFAGVLFAASSGPFNPGSGSTVQLPVIAGVILAGISLSGGRGNLWLLFLSIGFLSTVPTSLVFFGLSSDWQAVFQGLILIVAVSIDGLRIRRAGR